MMNKAYSDVTEHLIAETVADANQLRESSVAAEADNQVTNALAGRGADHEYEVSVGLFSSSNAHGRIAIVEALGGKPYGVNLKDCWREVCMAARYREQSTLHYVRRASSTDELYAECNVRWLPVEIASLASAVWKLYLLGDKTEAKSLVPLFELFDRRMDTTFLDPSPEDAEGYDVSVCVTLLLGRDEASLDKIAALLASIPIFKGVADFWSDDGAFRSFTEKAAQWHVDYSIPRSAQFWSFAPVASEVLFPGWILAIDEYRQANFGRPSSLGEHELLSLGRDILSFAESQKHAELPTLGMAEKHYAAIFGLRDTLDLSEWNRVLAVSSTTEPTGC